MATPRCCGVKAGLLNAAFPGILRDKQLMDNSCTTPCDDINKITPSVELQSSEPVSLNQPINI